MRIDSVTAHAFGPFAGERLELAEGMTVVVGDNESGKSSWQAAIFAALCGRRRGPGANGAVDREFKRRHQPWSGDEWLVTAILTLDDGRTIEMRQDLAGKVDCSAKDLDVGRDVADEIMVQGSPDASKWLGLDRGSFPATACVGQADLLAVRGGADGLQPFLQRAATSAQAGGTAAAAISLIKAFQRDNVGLERSTAVKPLQVAINRREQAVDTLGRAVADHAEYLSRMEAADDAASVAEAADRRLRECEAAVAADTADRLSTTARRAAELDAACGGGAPPARADDGLDEQVLRVLADYDARPAEPAAVSPTVAELDAQLADLPAAPEGDLSSDSAVVAAVEDLRRIQMALDAHTATRPSTLSTSLPAASERELLELAYTLDSPSVVVDAELVGRVTRAQAAAAPSAGGRRTPVLVIGAVLAALGVALLALGQPAIGVALVIGGAVAVGFGLVPRRGETSPAAMAELARAESALQSAEDKSAGALRAHDDAVARCADLGIEPDAAQLRDLAVAVANAAELRQRADSFAARSAQLASDLQRSAGSLQAALAARGCDVREDVTDPAALLAAAQEYSDACRDRARVAALAAGRATLLARREIALQAEGRAAADLTARARVAAALIAVAATCGLTSDDEVGARSGLDAWQRERAATRDAVELARQQWADLQALLAGHSVADLEADAAEAQRRAAELAVDTPTSYLDPVDAASQLESIRKRAVDARLAATETATAAREYAERIDSVADAEEALAAAEVELARVRRLSDTLTMTSEFLQKAEEEVHRSIAPLLNASLNAHLAAITNGRYTDALVDPDDLNVQVCGTTRNWRSADDLSFGTTEQIYLLLRVALTDHLTRDHDTCPLILDDVTVHADAIRTDEILDLLHTLSKDRQIVVFTQEQQVADWAATHLTGPRDAIRQLSPVPVA